MGFEKNVLVASETLSTVYLEGQGDLLSRLITPISQMISPAIHISYSLNS